MDNNPAYLSRKLAKASGWTVVAMALVLALSALAPAQANDPMPGGPWSRFCTNAWMDGHELKAQCRRSSGYMDYVEANVEECRGVVSYDPRLSRFNCAGGYGRVYGPGYGAGYGTPQGYGPGPVYGSGYGQGQVLPGQWRQYCTNGYMDGDELKATCRRADGSYRHTEANISDCRGRSIGYSIREGRLFCGG